ncbi:MAG: autotransporter domain-containing protein, partial [Verrucomicrobiota bacterium]
AGSAGDGGNVTVSNSGRIDTFGGGGHAILAQSVGGGGGIAGDVKRTKIPLTDINTGANLAFGRGGGNSGDGGDVVVNNTGIVTTQGTTAFGILAQSVGGGGGIAGNPGLLGIPLGAIYDWFAGSVGGDGSGGSVTVTHSGTIVTNDNASHGIFAQSAGGNGYGGAVQVTISGDILAAGEGSTGVFAQSRGDLGGADITIDVLGGTVLGGSGTGAGVRILEGDNNVLTNHGTVTTVLAAGGSGIAASTGDETIENFGTITGSVDLGTGGNAFNNREAGTFNPGQTVLLGSGNLLLNEGTLSPGGAGVRQHTQLTGNLVQTGTGTFLVDLDHQSGRSDRLIVNGISDLSGRLSVDLANPGYVPPGTQRFLVFSGLDNVTDSGLTLNAPASAVIAYDWTFEPREIEVVTHVNYAAAGLSGNAAAIGQAVNEIQLAGGTTAFAPVAATLVALPGLPELEQAYDQMSPDPYDNFTKSAEQVTRLSTRTLLKRIHSVRLALTARDDRGEGEAGEPVRLASRGGDASVRALLPGTGERTRSRYGMWFDVFGQAGDQGTVEGRTGYDYVAAGAAAGLDSLFGDRFLAGFAVGGSGTYVDLDEGRGNGDIQTVSGAVYASYFTASRYLDAAVSVGTQSYSNARYVAVDGLGGVATGEHGAVVYTGYVEGGENFRLSKCVLQPYAALQYISLDERGFAESGAGPLDLLVHDRRTDSLTSELGLRLDGVVETESGTLIPEFSLAWNHDFAIDDRVVTASFASAPFADFSVAGQEVEKNGLVVGAGITFQSKVGVSAALKYRGEFRENFHSNEILGEMLRYEF